MAREKAKKSTDKPRDIQANIIKVDRKKMTNTQTDRGTETERETETQKDTQKDRQKEPYIHRQNNTEKHTLNLWAEIHSLCVMTKTIALQTFQSSRSPLLG